MRFLIVDTFYPALLTEVYSSTPGLVTRPFAEQMRAIYDTGFARADFLPRHLRALGHEAEQVLANADAAQTQWALEHSLTRRTASSTAGRLATRITKSLRRRAGLTTPEPLPWLAEVLAAQVKHFRPDIVFACDPLQFPADFWRGVRGKGTRLIGECSCPIPDDADFSAFDLMVSADPNYVARFRRAGLRAELLRLAFEPAVLERLGPAPEPDGVVFIGSISPSHRRRIEMLEAVSRRVPIECHGTGAEHLAAGSPLRGCLRPPLFGHAMYRRLRAARIALNIHIDYATNVAGNMRLYEATGTGTLLVTDWRENLADMFEPGREVAAYRSPEECAELVTHFLNNASERDAVAAAGQRRTLRDHTYRHRMEQLAALAKDLF